MRHYTYGIFETSILNLKYPLLTKIPVTHQVNKLMLFRDEKRKIKKIEPVILNGRGTNFENINFDSREILALTRILGPTKY